MKRSSNIITSLLVLIGTFLLPSITFANQDINIIYKIKYLDGKNSNCFDVTTDFKGNPKGRIIAKLPKGLKNFTIRAKKGTISYKNPNDNIYLFLLDPNVDLEANYRFCMSNQLRDIDFPIIEDGLFHFISENLFILPIEDPEKMINVKIQFSGFPSNYVILTNHNINKRNYYINTTLRSLSRSIIAGGNFNVKTIFIQDYPVHIAIKGTWSFIKNDELTDYLQKIINIQRSFWNDYDNPHFVVMLFDNNIPNGQGGLGATLYENVLSMVFSDTHVKNKPLLLGSLSHELFHVWLGNKIRIPEPQGNLQWFFEGINDFYGWQLAIESGQVSKNDYIEYYNKLLKEYSLSPFKGSLNSEISKHFQLRNPFARLAMIRGHIVFTEILNNFHKKNQSRDHIDLALKEVFYSYGDKAKYLSYTELNAIFEKHLGAKNWKEAEKVLLFGNPINLSQTLFSKNLKLQKISVEAPSFGFDIKNLIKEQRIKSLESTSKAALAGLKENDKVIQYGIDMSGRISNTYIIVDELNNQRIVNFTPDKVTKIISQYEQA